MPLYEYECSACQHRFEQIQRFSDPLVRKCPSCGKSRVKKLPSSPAIQFKGTGFYINDYQRKGSSTSLPDHGESEKNESEKKKKDEKDSGKAAGKSDKKAGKKE